MQRTGLSLNVSNEVNGASSDDALSFIEDTMNLIYSKSDEDTFVRVYESDTYVFKVSSGPELEGEKIALETLSREVADRYTALVYDAKLSGPAVDMIKKARSNGFVVSVSKKYKDYATLQELSTTPLQNNALLFDPSKWSDEQKDIVFDELKDTVYTVFANLWANGGVLHRDLKIDNILAFKQGNDIRFSVLDFDLAGLSVGDTFDDNGMNITGHMDTKGTENPRHDGTISTMSLAPRGCHKNVMASPSSISAFPDPDTDKSYFRSDVERELTSIDTLLRHVATYWLQIPNPDVRSKNFRLPFLGGNCTYIYSYQYPTDIGGKTSLRFPMLSTVRVPLPMSNATVTLDGGDEEATECAARPRGIILVGFAALLTLLASSSTQGWALMRHVR